MYPAADIGLSDYFSYALNPLNLRNHGLHLVKALSRHQVGEDTDWEQPRAVVKLCISNLYKFSKI